MIYKIAEFRVRTDAVTEARGAIKEFVQRVRSYEPDTLRYDVYQRSDVDFLHFMAFRNEEAEVNHRQTSHVQVFVKKLYPLCQVEPRFTDLSDVA